MHCAYMWYNQEVTRTRKPELPAGSGAGMQAERNVLKCETEILKINTFFTPRTPETPHQVCLRWGATLPQAFQYLSHHVSFLFWPPFLGSAWRFFLSTNGLASKRLQVSFQVNLKS